QELKIVEHFDLKSMGLGSADLVHVLVEAKKLAFADRERWGADPRTLEEVHGDPPFAELLSADYAAQLAAGIDGQRAAPIRAIAGGRAVPAAAPASPPTTPLPYGHPAPPNPTHRPPDRPSATP